MKTYIWAAIGATLVVTFFSVTEGSGDMTIKIVHSAQNFLSLPIKSQLRFVSISLTVFGIAAGLIAFALSFTGPNKLSMVLTAACISTIIVGFVCSEIQQRITDN